MEIKIFTDGGARGNPGPAAVGVVIKRSKINPSTSFTLNIVEVLRTRNQKSKIIEEEIVAKFGKRIGVTTNNVAEYQAVIEALKWVKENKSIYNLPWPGRQGRQFTIYNFFLDSKLIVNQLNGIFKVKDSNLRELLFCVRQLEAEVGGTVFYNLITREENFMADREVNSALD